MSRSTTNVVGRFARPSDRNPLGWPWSSGFLLSLEQARAAGVDDPATHGPWQGFDPRMRDERAEIIAATTEKGVGVVVTLSSESGQVRRVALVDVDLAPRSEEDRLARAAADRGGLKAKHERDAKTFEQMGENAAERARRTLVHYVSMIGRAAGVNVDEPGEVEGIVDDIVAAAVAKAAAARVRAS